MDGLAIRYKLFESRAHTHPTKQASASSSMERVLKNKFEA